MNRVTQQPIPKTPSRPDAIHTPHLRLTSGNDPVMSTLLNTAETGR